MAAAGGSMTMVAVDPVNPTRIATSVDQVPGRPAQRPLGRIVWFVVALAAIWVTLLFGSEIGAWWDGVSSTLGSPETFRAWVEGFGAWGPVVFFLAQAVQVIVVPIPGTLFPPVGALAFGPWPALGLSLAGMALGSAAVFLIARRWGRPLAMRLVGADRISRYENLMTARGGLLIWLVFLLPLLPDDAVCALAGLSGISFRRFMLIATVGRIPAVAIGVFTMAGLEGAPAWVWALAAGLFALIMWAGLNYGRSLETRLLRRMGREVPGRISTPVRPDQTQAAPVIQTGRADRLRSLLAVVVATTVVGVGAGLVAGVSDLTTVIVLVWGVVLAVMLGAARGAD